MHFDPRERAALRAAGLDDDGLRAVLVEDGRTSNDETVEPALGGTVNDRVRFARDPEAL